MLLLDDDERYDMVWNRVYNELGFRPGMHEAFSFDIKASHAVYSVGEMTAKQIDLM